MLQKGEFERVGGTRTLKVDVRVIAATNRDLEAEVKAGEFREDLYYRLNAMPIFIPSLAERIEDVPDLAHFLVAKIGKQQGRELQVTDSALRVLMRHDCPGNVRELENCLERAAVMTDEGVLEPVTTRSELSVCLRIAMCGLAGNARHSPGIQADRRDRGRSRHVEPIRQLGAQLGYEGLTIVGTPKLPNRYPRQHGCVKCTSQQKVTRMRPGASGPLSRTAPWPTPPPWGRWLGVRSRVSCLAWVTGSPESLGRMPRTDTSRMLSDSGRPIRLTWGCWPTTSESSSTDKERGTYGPGAGIAWVDSYGCGGSGRS